MTDKPIYVIIQGAYSDKHILCYVESEDEAKRYCELWSGKAWDDWNINIFYCEAYPATLAGEHPVRYKEFCFFAFPIGDGPRSGLIYKDEVESCNDILSTRPIPPRVRRVIATEYYEEHFSISVFIEQMEDEDEMEKIAEKIAQDYWSQYLAEHEWL